jgi:hypothetical protein
MMSFYGPPPLALEDLKNALREARELLLRHGDKYVSARLADLELRLARGDMTAIQSALSEATGSMGSLSDRILYASNGDRIEPWEEPSVNEKLRALVLLVKERADSARAEIWQERNAE